MAPIVLVVPEGSYRTNAFVQAAATLRADVVVAGGGAHPLARADSGGPTVVVNLDEPESAGATIAGAVPNAAAVIGVDDGAVLVANSAARRLGVLHNPVQAVAATRDKLLMRRLLADAGVRQPKFVAAAGGEVVAAAAAVGFPVVVKPTNMNAGRGVIRANNAAEAGSAEVRIRALLVADCGDGTAPLIVEQFVAGNELAVEGLLGPNGLEVLALIDKPEPAGGPHFAETFLTTPSRLPASEQEAAEALVGDACAALGLVTGPVHAEVRISANGTPYLLELAARSIGGLCSRALTFGLLGESLEVLILRAALGWQQKPPAATRPAAGVLMLPVAASGTFVRLEGVEAALEAPGIDGLEVTVSAGSDVVALPEGSRYLGFVFASGANPHDVERSLRAAATELMVVIDGEAVDPLAGQPWERS